MSGLTFIKANLRNGSAGVVGGRWRSRERKDLGNVGRYICAFDGLIRAVCDCVCDFLIHVFENILFGGFFFLLFLKIYFTPMYGCTKIKGNSLDTVKIFYASSSLCANDDIFSDK